MISESGYPQKTRCLGLIGGLGGGRHAIHYYKHGALAAEAESREINLVMAHARTARVFEYVDARDPHGLATYLNGFLIRLKAAGAEVAAVPARTQTFLPRLRRASLQAIRRFIFS